MTEENGFVAGLLRNIQAGITEVNQRLDKLERRQTAGMHFEQHVLVHLTTVIENQDDAKAETRAVRAEIAELKQRLDRVEVR